MKIGLFYGSFNPIHSGHLIIANNMVQTTDIQKVWFVVSPQNPLKKSKALLPELDRLNMTRAAVYDNSDFDVSDVELQMPKPSYTVDSMSYLSEKNPDEEFVLIIGEDNLESFQKWKNHEKILEIFGLYVYPRANAFDCPLRNHPKVKLVEAPYVDISATFIRQCVKKNRSIKYLVPDSVELIIRDKKFFAD